MKASDAIELAYKSRVYCAYLGGPVNGRQGRLCFVLDALVDEKKVTPLAAMKARAAISAALDGFFLSDLLDKRDDTYERVYHNRCLRRRRQALAFWRKLVADLRAKGE